MQYFIKPNSDLEQERRFNRTNFRKTKTLDPASIEKGSMVLFYTSRTKSVQAHAVLKETPVERPELQDNPNYIDFIWFAELEDLVVYDDPIDLSDPKIRERLDWFNGVNTSGQKRSLKSWGNFVITTREISQHDFLLLSKEIEIGDWIRNGKISFNEPEAAILDEEIFPEGKEIYRLHKIKERNSRLIEQRKKQALIQDGTLNCEVCNFNFYETYGEVGKN